MVQMENVYSYYIACQLSVLIQTPHFGDPEARFLSDPVCFLKLAKLNFVSSRTYSVSVYSWEIIDKSVCHISLGLDIIVYICCICVCIIMIRNLYSASYQDTV